MAGKPRKSPKAGPGLPNVEALIDGTGQITIGRLHPFDCVAIANDENISLAMLVRRPGEALSDLLQRLDVAIEAAYEYDEFIDEVNGPG